MRQKQKTGITPTRSENFPEWYQNAIKVSSLAENSPVRGCMVIKPWGYALWENITNVLDTMLKKEDIKNAYFPLLIPLSFIEKEAEHVEGFAKECAIVTHNKIIQDQSGKLIPGNSLPEPLVIRPTSETIIGDSFSKWIKSYRDLPIMINQWANVVRWEMRTRMFLRTNEFLWQEGHTAHSTSEEAIERTKTMLKIYETLAKKYLAMPVISGRKSETERFPGAIDTLCIEGMMQDRKALQAGTSHFLGQNFAKSSNIRFQTQNKLEEFAWTTSWGVSTRLIGSIIMTHGDDDGIIIPPRVAPSHMVLLPIFKTLEEKQKVMDFTSKLTKKLKTLFYYGKKIILEVDDRDTGGARNWEWIKKGIPLRVEIGPKDVEKQSVCIGRRDLKYNNKLTMNQNEFIAKIPHILDEIHNNIFQQAKQFRIENTLKIDTIKDFNDFFTPINKFESTIHGGFALSHWCGEKKCEEQIKKKLAVSIRCIPITPKVSKGTCINCKAESKNRVVFAKAY